MRLVFKFFQKDLDGGKFPMWDVYDSPKPWLHPDGSTISIEGWKELLCER
jgi:hypothetical protein